MPNQTVNKVQFGNQTVMDITDTTADAADVIQGEVFYTKSGVRSTGTLGDATQSTHGLMSSSDKVKLDGIDAEMYKTITTPASVITITDGADDVPITMEVGIEPIQDLHGYANPWPAGGGKNLLPMTVDRIKANNNWTWDGNTATVNGVTFTIMTDTDNNVTGIKINGTATSETRLHILSKEVSDYYSFFSKNTAYKISCFPAGGNNESRLEIAPYNGSTWSRTNYNQKYNGDAEVTFTDTTADTDNANVYILIPNGAALNNVIVKPMIRLASVTDATFAPYSNICPISGWTGVNVANISDSEKQPYFSGLLNGTYGFVDLGTLTWTYDSTYTRFNSDIYSQNAKIAHSPRTEMVLCAKYEPITDGRAVSSVTDKSIYRGSNYDLSVHDSAYTDAAAFKTAMSGVYIVFELATPTTPTITQEQYNIILQSFNLSGWLIPISWQSEAGTVYGGTLTLNQDGTGSLVVDRASVDLGTLQWTSLNYSESRYFYTDISGMKDLGETIMSKYEKTPYKNQPADKHYTYGWLYIGAKKFIIRDSTYSTYDNAQFKTAMSGVQLVYELATPVTYILNPGQVKTLLGLNNIWADTGDINSLTYASSTNNVISTEERYKLSTVEEGAQVNPGNATQSAAGLMSAADKTKLDSITGNVYTDYTITIAVADWTASNGEYVYTWTNSAITTQCLADVIFVTDPDTVLAGLSLSADKVTGGMQFVCSGTPSGALTVKIRIIDSDTTAALQNATTTQDGIMSAQDKVKLDAVYQASAYHESDMGIVETTNTATHAISSGQYVIWKGQLYTADSAIAVGATLAASGGSKNLTAVANGGLNALNNNITTLSSSMPQFEVVNTGIIYKATSATYEYVGLSIQIPALTGYMLEFQSQWASGQPDGVVIASSSSTITTNGTYVRNDGSSYACICGYTDSTRTVHMWVKRGSVPAQANAHWCRGIFIKGKTPQ